MLLELGIEPRSGACEAPVLTVIRFELIDIYYPNLSLYKQLQYQQNFNLKMKQC